MEKLWGILLLALLVLLPMPAGAKSCCDSEKPATQAQAVGAQVQQPAATGQPVPTQVKPEAAQGQQGGEKTQKPQKEGK